jgi:hypothetical protein
VRPRRSEWVSAVERAVGKRNADIPVLFTESTCHTVRLFACPLVTAAMDVLIHKSENEDFLGNN